MICVRKNCGNLSCYVWIAGSELARKVRFQPDTFLILYNKIQYTFKNVSVIGAVYCKLFLEHLVSFWLELFDLLYIPNDCYYSLPVILFLLLLPSRYPIPVFLLPLPSCYPIPATTPFLLSYSSIPVTTPFLLSYSCYYSLPFNLFPLLLPSYYPIPATTSLLLSYSRYYSPPIILFLLLLPSYYPIPATTPPIILFLLLIPILSFSC